MSGNDGRYTLEEVKRCLGVSDDRGSDTVMISPNQARLLLQHTNYNNRNIRDKHVGYYMRLLRNNNWLYTGDAVSWDSKGMLTNGQHRLTAIARCNESCKVLVAFGVEASTAIDNGAKRSFTDNVKITDFCDERIRNNATIHKVFNVAFLLEPTGSPRDALSVTPDELIDYMNKYADDLLTCDNAGLFTRLRSPGCSAVIVKAVLFLAYMNGVDIDLLAHIVDVLKTGIAEDKTDVPIIGLRDTLGRLKGGGREINEMRAKAVSSCINKCIKGNTTKRLDLKGMCYSFDFRV